MVSQNPRATTHPRAFFPRYLHIRICIEVNPVLRVSARMNIFRFREKQKYSNFLKIWISWNVLKFRFGTNKKRIKFPKKENLLNLLEDSVMKLHDNDFSKTTKDFLHFASFFDETSKWRKNRGWTCHETVPLIKFTFK